MKITEIFQQLESGELAQQQSLYHIETGVKPEHYKDFINHINLGLTKLYTRFDIRTKDCFVQMMNGIAEYDLTWPHAKTNTSTVDAAAIKYVIDSPYKPFGDDVLRITKVFTEIGEELPLNDLTEPKSVFTTGQRTLQIPWKVDGDVVNVMYRAQHDKIKIANYDSINEIEVYLPDVYLEPLLNFIAARYFMSIGGKSGTPTGQMFMQKYRESCQELELYGVPNQDHSESNDYDQGGWP